MISIPERLAIQYGVKNGDTVRAISEGKTPSEIRANLRLVMRNNYVHPLIGSEGDNIRPGQLVEIVIEEKYVMLSDDILQKHKINDGDQFVIQLDENADVNNKLYINTPLL